MGLYKLLPDGQVGVSASVDDKRLVPIVEKTGPELKGSEAVNVPRSLLILHN